MQPRIWLLYLVIPGRFGLPVTSLLITMLMCVVLMPWEDSRRLESSSLFFILTAAYMVPTFAYIIHITQLAMDALREELALEEADFNALRLGISQRSLGWNCLVVVGGLLGAAAHLSIIANSRDTNILEGLADGMELGGDLGAIITWLIMFAVSAALIENGIRFGRLAKHLPQLDLLRIDKLLPFARVAIASTLAMIGAMAFFPLLSMDSGASASTILPGLVGTGASMLTMVLLPIWPIHGVIKRAKNVELEAVNEQLEGLLLEGKSDDELSRLNSLLSFRSHLQQVSEWPINLGGIGRLGFYLIIPPLTWIGAALIENIVDAFV